MVWAMTLQLARPNRRTMSGSHGSRRDSLGWPPRSLRSPVAVAPDHESTVPPSRRRPGGEDADGIVFVPF